MHWFNKDTVSCKQEIFSDDALRSLLSKESFLSNVSDALSLIIIYFKNTAIVKMRFLKKN